MGPDSGEELDRREGAVRDHDDASTGQPTVDLQGGLTSPVDQGFGDARLVGVEAGRRGEQSEKRQPHDAPGPRNLDQKLGRQPAQAAGFDKMPLGGADGIAIDAARIDLGSPAPLDGVVQADQHGRPRWREHADQQAQELACRRPRRPGRSTENGMVGREIIFLVSTQHAQRRDRAFAWRQDGAHNQQ